MCQRLQPHSKGLFCVRRASRREVGRVRAVRGVRGQRGCTGQGSLGHLLSGEADQGLVRNLSVAQTWGRHLVQGEG